MTEWPRALVAPRAARRGPVSRVLARASALRHLDWVLLGAVLALAGVGSVLVWSATREELERAGDDPTALFKRQLLNLAIGMLLGSVAALVDHRQLRIYAPLVYVASCLGLVAVLTPLGATINGSHSWIVLGGGFQVQPSEFAKVALVVGMALLLGKQRQRDASPGHVDVLAVLALAALPMALIVLQPDLGTAMVFVFTIFGTLAISGAPSRWLVGLVLAGVVAAGAVWHLGLLEDYQVKRFTAFANPAADIRGAGYNSTQARIAVGSGGVVGKGLFQGSQTNGDFVPAQQTDFIFTVAGEELGFVGAGSILLLLGVVLLRGLRIATRADDLFGALVASAVVCWLAFQTFQNIGMTLGIMPVTGLPLPFVSYGGSSMFANLVAVGLLQNVHLRSMRA
ncbi:MAG TPA: rod shape-determining protein RodA [Mycobacteriales bacterium]|nr:rod shape-determining protein RodA [Mycobacteriales bacterium]